MHRLKNMAMAPRWYTYVNSASAKTTVSDAKASFSRLAKSENPQFTCVNEDFSDERNAEPLAH